MAHLTLNLVQGSVVFSFSVEAARNLKQEIQKLMQSLKTVSLNASSGSNRLPPQKSMEYRYTADVFLEVFCNPNIYPSPFAAKVLLTLRDDKIRITTEAELTQLIEDLDQYLTSQS
jgi:hypothetical protein